jgi:ribonucleoside-diphosphate reductase alpha chain
MAKYLVETYYTCTFKVNHYLDSISEAELKGLEKRDDGKFEVLDVKLDNRKTKNLDSNNKTTEEKKADIISSNNQSTSNNIEKSFKIKYSPIGKKQYEI